MSVDPEDRPPDRNPEPEPEKPSTEKSGGGKKK